MGKALGEHTGREAYIIGEILGKVLSSAAKLRVRANTHIRDTFTLLLCLLHNKGLGKGQHIYYPTTRDISL
jgi:hypothetical protein